MTKTTDVLREKYIQDVEKILPPELKGKGSELVNMIDSFYNEGVGILQRINGEPELIGPLKGNAIRRLFTLFGMTLYFQEGIFGLTEAGRSLIRNIVAERAQRDASPVEDKPKPNQKENDNEKR